MRADYDMSDSGLGRGMLTVVAIWVLAAVLAFAAVGCKSKPKPPGDLDHWDHQGEVIL
jgi:hypothetical protein